MIIKPKNCQILAVLLSLLIIGSLHSNAAPVVVTAVGLSKATNKDWLSQGLATLNGTTVGVNWSVSGSNTGKDNWKYGGGQPQKTLPAPTTLEWPAGGAYTALGFTGTDSSAEMIIGNDLLADLAADSGTSLRISEVAPAPGDYFLNGVKQTATELGQVLLWTTPAAGLSAGDTLTFTSTATVNGMPISAGPIGLSAVPK